MAIKGSVISASTIKSALVRLAALTKGNRDLCLARHLVAEEFNVTPQTIYNWQKRFETTGSYEPGKRGRRPENPPAPVVHLQPVIPAPVLPETPASSGLLSADCLDDVLDLGGFPLDLATTGSLKV